MNATTKITTIVASVFLLASCNFGAGQGVNDDPGQYLPQSSSNSQTTCEAGGGTWASGGLSPVKMCFPAYDDAGQSCTVSDQCQGVCLAHNNSCAASIMFGCYEFFDDQGDKIMICVD